MQSTLPEKSADPLSHTYPVMEWGVDYITVTCNDAEKREAFESFAVAELRVEHDTGNKLKPVRMMQFEGYAAGSVSYGTTHEMAMLRLSSKAAWMLWKQAYQLSTNCSRLDLQVTISGVSEPWQLIMAHRAEALAAVATWTKPREVAIRDSNRTGPTLYLNGRASQKFGRIYDKFSESKLEHYRGCVRYELELKGKLASLVTSGLVRSEEPGIELRSRVAGFLRDVGISQLWQSDGYEQCCSPRKRTNDDRRLEWFERQVRPALDQLRANGRAADAMIALGLPPLSVDGGNWQIETESETEKRK